MTALEGGKYWEGPFRLQDMLEEVEQDQMPDDSHRRWAKKDIHRAGDREIHFNMTPLWYQIGQLATYGSAHWKKPWRNDLPRGPGRRLVEPEAGAAGGWFSQLKVQLDAEPHQVL